MAAKKKVTKKAPAKKAAKKADGKTPAKKAAKKVVKKAPAKKSPAKKTPAKKAAAKKSPAKKAPAKKAPAKKAAATKAAPKGKSAAKGASGAGKTPTKAAPAKSETPKSAEVNDVPVVAVPPKKPIKPVKITAFVRKQQQNLLDLRDQLMDAMYGVQQETLRKAAEGGEASGSGMHQGDAGSDAYDRDFALNLLSQEQDALQEIEAALERVSAGIYGFCEMSGKKIPQARLEAIPFARLTVECQTTWEKEFPQRRFRSEDAAAIAFIAANGAPVSLDEAG